MYDSLSRMNRQRPRGRTLRLVESLEPRELLHAGAGISRASEAFYSQGERLRTHVAAVVSTVQSPPSASAEIRLASILQAVSNPSGPASGATDFADSSDNLVPFLDTGGLLRIYDSQRQRIFDTGLPASQIRTDAFNRFVYFLTPETSKDLDRDGAIDRGELDLQIFNDVTGRVFNTGIPVTGNYAINTGSLTPLAAFLVSEAQLHRDLNGNGTTTNTVAAVYSPLDHRFMNTRQAADAFTFTNNLMIFTTNEAAQGRDLNHDGKVQATDTVLQVYDPLEWLPYGKLTNLGQVNRL